MKDLIGMQPFNRSQVNQSQLFSLDYETVSEPAAPLLHQESRFLFVLDGVGKIVIQRKEYDFRKGTLVSILPWQVSEINVVEKPVRFVIIRYHFDTVQNIIHLFSDVSGDPCSSLTRIEDHAAVQLSEDKIADVMHIVQLIREEIGVESSKSLHIEKELANIATLNLIVYLTAVFTRAASEQPESSRSEDADTVDILRYMYLHCNKKLTLNKIAQQFYYRESTVSEHITQMTGLSFIDLLTEMRICKTVNYLLYTDLTLRELADILGFVDESHISKVFAARVGDRIGQYRATYQKVQDICHIEENRIGYTIVNYIYRNYADALTAKNVATKFQITVPKLQQLLVEQVEFNFEDFLNQIRVNHACELLITTDLSVLDVALDVGYNSPKTLTRNFVKLKVMTPSAFRTKFRSESGQVL